MTIPAEIVFLFGTNQPAPGRRRLKAGPLTAILEEGNLRDIRFDGVEVVRAINYLARDVSWGTYTAQRTDLEVVEGEESFEVRYKGLCGAAGEGFAYRMNIRGHAAGLLELDVVGEALEDFTTNRTGFVILHPADAAGGKLTLIHSGGEREATSFPDLISPDQPAFDITGVIHEPAPGMFCTIGMEGDAFEMEDQRNWADASFKTYVRPLSRPRPYVIAKGTLDRQRVHVRVEGKPPLASRPRSGAIAVTVGDETGRMPAMALFVDETGIGAARPSPGLMQTLIVRIDLSARPDVASLVAAAKFAKLCQASVAIELIVDNRDCEAEAEIAMRFLAAARVMPASILVSPRREFTSRPSRTLPEGERPAGEFVAALRRSGFAARIGAGTPSYFTEFNRNPPHGDADFVYFSVAAIVHAADDVSVMETIEVYPQLLESARALCPDKPVWLGPCTIGVRHNPYGVGVQPNPDGHRVPSAGIDPRQPNLFGATFAAGVAARAAESQVRMLTIAAPAGPFGLFGDDGRPRPICAIQTELAAAAGATCYRLCFSGSGAVGVAYEGGSGSRALIANLTPDPLALSLPENFRVFEVIEREGGLSRLSVKDGTVNLPGYQSAILSA